MRRSLGTVLVTSALFVMISTGCSRRKESVAPVPVATVAPPPTPPVHEHAALGRIGDAHEGSTLAVAKLGSRTLAYVADEDDGSIRAVDLATHEELSVTSLAGHPSHARRSCSRGVSAAALRSDGSGSIRA